MRNFSALIINVLPICISLHWLTPTKVNNRIKNGKMLYLVVVEDIYQIIFQYGFGINNLVVENIVVLNYSDLFRFTLPLFILYS